VPSEIAAHITGTVWKIEQRVGGNVAGCDARMILGR